MDLTSLSHPSVSLLQPILNFLFLVVLLHDVKVYVEELIFDFNYFDNCCSTESSLKAMYSCRSAEQSELVK